MHKVVVERPRWNPGPDKRGRRANLDVDLLPRCEGMRRAHSQRKCFSDLLGPLRRWLHSQLGRPWNDVYSEACRVIKPDSVIRAHIKTHLLEFVMRDTFVRDGEVWCFTRRGWGWNNEVPIRELSDRAYPFYVHPATGLLSRMPRVPKRLHDRQRLNLALQSVRRWIADDRLLVKWRGIWFECDMRPVPVHGEYHFDLLWRAELHESHAREAYGKPVYCASKRQLSRTALRTNKLSNGMSDQPACLAAVLGSKFWELARASNGNPHRSRLRQSGMLCRSRRRSALAALHVLSSRSTKTPSAGFVETPALAFVFSPTAVNLNIFTTAPTTSPTSSSPRNLPGQKRGPCPNPK